MAYGTMHVAKLETVSPSLPLIRLTCSVFVLGLLSSIVCMEALGSM